jgi:hypothetical protein
VKVCRTGATSSPRVQPVRSTAVGAVRVGQELVDEDLRHGGARVGRLGGEAGVQRRDVEDAAELLLVQGDERRIPQLDQVLVVV